MIIDFHTHIFPPRINENRGDYIERDPCFAALYSDEKAKLSIAEDLIESMDRDGVDISVVLNIGWSSHELCVETNDYIMESVSRYRDRLVGFCAVQPNSTDETVKEIERCVKGGIKGIGELRPDTQQIDLNNEKVIAPLAETLIEYDLILLVHASEPAGHEYPGKGQVTPEILYPFINACPDITLVCAHWGGGLPFYELMPEVRKSLKNTYYDTAASPFLYEPQVYRQVSRLVGADKVLFGSDYPLLSQGRLIKEIGKSELTEEEKGLILSGNARKLLRV